VVGNAFLHSMVRTIVGSLVEVGVGRQGVAWLGDALAAQERSAAGPTAPAQGLTLWSVAYDEEVWLAQG
jgi:tRNA pseudouridine38-40 synthase